MLTVPEAARRVGRDPETIRRWIRSGRLHSRRVGTQHVIEERDLDALGKGDTLPVPRSWRTMSDGRPQPNWVQLIQRSRRGR